MIAGNTMSLKSMLWLLCSIAIINSALSASTTTALPDQPGHTSTSQQGCSEHAHCEVAGLGEATGRVYQGDTINYAAAIHGPHEFDKEEVSSTISGARRSETSHLLRGDDFSTAKAGSTSTSRRQTWNTHLPRSNLPLGFRVPDLRSAPLFPPLEFGPSFNYWSTGVANVGVRDLDTLAQGPAQESSQQTTTLSRHIRLLAASSAIPPSPSDNSPPQAGGSSDTIPPQSLPGGGSAAPADQPPPSQTVVKFQPRSIPFPSPPTDINRVTGHHKQWPPRPPKPPRSPLSAIRSPPPSPLPPRTRGHAPPIPPFPLSHTDNSPSLHPQASSPSPWRAQPRTCQ